MASISCQHIYKIYPGATAPSVTDFNLEIKDKEFIIFVGPSGCGKSTTLRMIAGLEEISKGEMYIGGRLINDVPPKDRDIAMVFQSYALYPHMTVYKNIAFGLELRKTPKDEIDKRVHEAAKILEIEHLLDRKPKALSGGQRQRVALGRAMVRNPAVFLLDEPLSNLDAKLRTSMRTEIIKLHQKLATTFIYVTHDQTEAMTMGDRIVVMKDGIVQQVDTPQNLYDFPINMFVAGFIGSPQMNFLDATLNKDGNGFYTVAPDGATYGGANQGDLVYGIYDDGGANTNRAVLHDAKGYYYFDNAGTRVDLDKGLSSANVTSFSSDNAKSVYEYAASLNTAASFATKPDTFLEPARDNAGNSLASLMTGLEQKPDGTWYATVNVNSNAATMTAAERQDNAIVANKDTYVNQTEQNGYGSGRMTNMEFDTNGVLYVTYNNGVTLPMWQLCIYDFENYQGLYREGGNLYSATMESGNPMLGVAGDNGFGSVLGYNIEQSNVDMTTEFVQMIATQRGFQANSKGVTTTDTMLETVINMKR